jgi:hypothetical protein
MPDPNLTQQEIPVQPVNQPVICNPYMEPTKYWLYDPEAFEAFTGLTLVPFAPGSDMCVAVKVIDPRRNEVMKVERIG